MLSLEERYEPQVGNQGVKALVALSKLVSLSLAGCDHINDSCVPALASMTQLQSLDLMWTGRHSRSGQPLGITDKGQITTICHKENDTSSGTAYS